MTVRRFIVSILGLAVIGCGTQARPTQSREEVLAIRDVQLFDGEHFVTRTNVIIRGGRIVAVGPAVPIPEDANVIDGNGRTLLPGFIDAHIHVMRRDMLEASAVLGVTTVYDMFNVRLADMHRRVASAVGAADFHSAGIALNQPAGYLTNFVPDVPTVVSAADCKPFVEARVAEGSEWIKIAVEDGTGWGRPMPVHDEETLTACVAAAHARGKLAVAHVSTIELALRVLRAGADGLVHLPIDIAADDALVQLLRNKHAFVIPTASLWFAYAGRANADTLLADPRLATYATAQGGRLLTARLPFKTMAPIETLKQRIGKLHRAGVTLLVGTDAPTPGTVAGVSYHDELALLVESGLAPKHVLHAATSAAASAFRFGDRGRIAVGLRADLVLVRGTPLHDITVVRDIEDVWIAGVRVDRERHARRVATMNRYIVLREATKLSEAVQLLADHLATDPLYDDGLYQLACAEALSKQPDRAIVHLRDAIARDSAFSASAAGDEDLESLRTREDFKALTRSFAP